MIHVTKDILIGRISFTYINKMAGVTAFVVSLVLLIITPVCKCDATYVSEHTDNPGSSSVSRSLYSRGDLE